MISISENEKKIVISILKEVVPHYKVFAFGSRTNGTNKKFSDLDLIIKDDNPVSDKIIRTLKEAFSYSNLPYRVDIVSWNNIDNNFKQIIKKDLTPIT